MYRRGEEAEELLKKFGKCRNCVVSKISRGKSMRRSKETERYLDGGGSGGIFVVNQTCGNIVSLFSYVSL
jgi:hypothetical protein